MLDAQFIRENLDAVKTNCRNRNVKADVDRVVQLDDERKRLVQETQTVQQRQNEIAKLTKGEKDAAKRQALIQEGKSLKEKVAGLEKQLKQAETDLRAALITIPNVSHPAAPVGTTAEDNKVIRRWGEPHKFDFPATDHVALAESLNLVDFEAGASVAGQKFYFLKNEAVLLELALIQYAMGALIREGYTPIITPDVARVDVLEGIGFIPRGPETQIYSLENTDLCLIATAEITLGGMHRDQILDELQLPIKYVGLSHCFRTEAGAPGATRAAFIVSTSSPRSRCSLSVPLIRAIPSTMSCFASRRAFFKALDCPITSSIPAPAIWEDRPTANSTWKPGCRAVGRAVSTAK